MPLLSLIATLQKNVERTEVLSYQGPYGVGYAVAQMEPRLSTVQLATAVPEVAEAEPVESPAEQPIDLFAPSQMPAPTDQFTFAEGELGEQVLALARASFEAYAQLGRRPLLPDTLPSEFLEERACFVTLHANGRLRGCVGTILPAYQSLANEIVENAIGAASRDYRFAPLLATELVDVVCSVDILSTPEPVTSADMLDPARYGMVVKQHDRIGVLLPGIPEITTRGRAIPCVLGESGDCNSRND